MSYITFPMAVDAEDVLQDAIDYLQGKFANWKPNPGNLDSEMLVAWSTEAAQLRTLASEVPDGIFRWFGATVVQIPPVDATPATAMTTWTMIDNAGYQIPAGTQLSITPTDGSDPVAFETLQNTVVPAGSTVANNVPIVAVISGAAGTGLGSVGSTVNLEDPLTYVLSVVLVAATVGGTDAEDDSTYLGRLRDDLSLLSPRLILPRDFALDAKNIAAVWRALAIDGYNPFHNLLTANQADAETDASGWVAVANTVVSSTGAQSANGAKSIGLTSVAAGDMTAATTPGNTIAVVPGDTITAIGSFRTAAAARVTKIGVRWRDAGGVFISDSYNAGSADSLAAWTVQTVTAIAPANAAFASVIGLVQATGGAGELHYLDKASLRRGTTTDWVAGGTAETGNARMVTVAVTDQSGADPGSAVKSSVQTRQQALREVNFIVNVIGPIITSIDVTFNVVTVPGYTTSDVAARAQAAVAAYLASATWGEDPSARGDAQTRTWVVSNVVRFQELSTVLNNVDGVDHWSLLTIALHGGALGAADLTLPGIAPLAAPGTIIGSAS